MVNPQSESDKTTRRARSSSNDLWLVRLLRTGIVCLIVTLWRTGTLRRFYVRGSEPACVPFSTRPYVVRLVRWGFKLERHYYFINCYSTIPKYILFQTSIWDHSKSVQWYSSSLMAIVPLAIIATFFFLLESLSPFSSFITALFRFCSTIHVIVIVIGFTLRWRCIFFTNFFWVTFW